MFIFYYDYKHLLFLDKPYEPEINFARSLNVMPRTVACNCMT